MTAAAPEPIPTTMRAVIADGFGDRSVLRTVTLPVPQPGPTEILVQVHAAGVNPVDWKSRQSGSFGLWGDPVVLGWDVSGVVVARGAGASGFAVGGAVYGMPRFPHQAGAYAEYVTAPSRQFAPKPPSLSHVQAAALPLAALTAWQALAEYAAVLPSQRVLIHAAGGGVGHLAVQIARTLGAEVIATASASKHDWLRSLGAGTLIDYHATDFQTAVSGVDVVLNAIGSEYDAASLAVLRDGGTLVNLPGGAPGPETVALAAQRGIRADGILVEPDRHSLLALNLLVEAGELMPTIAATFPLEQVADAHALGEEGHVAGKLVLTVR